MSKRQTRFPAGSLRACTHRRTTKDVDGRRYDVWCTVGIKLLHSHAWFYVRFDDGTVASRHDDELYATPFGRPKFHASQSDTSFGFWWVNAFGTAERPATSYEIARSFVADETPSPGWTLLDGASCVLRRRSNAIGAESAPSEVETAERERKSLALMKRRKARRDHAFTMVAKHERATKRHQKCASRWRVILKRAEKAIEES